jgi:hypothetical protein
MLVIAYITMIIVPCKTKQYKQKCGNKQKTTGLVTRKLRKATSSKPKEI